LGDQKRERKSGLDQRLFLCRDAKEGKGKSLRIIKKPATRPEKAATFMALKERKAESYPRGEERAFDR